MPLVFTLKTHQGEVVFNGALKEVRCGAFLPNGQACGEDSTLHVEYCTFHLRSILALEIKQATDPKMGLGLFACGARDEVVFAPNKKPWKAPHRVVGYVGQVISAERLAARYGLHSAPFAMQLTVNKIIDSALVRGVGSYVNHSHNANCRSVKSKGGVSIVAIKEIRGGEELFVNYHPTKQGKNYNGFLYEGSVYETAKPNAHAHAQKFCYCQKADDGKLYLECSGGNCWHARNRVHATCAALEEVPETFTCEDCAHADAVEKRRVRTSEDLAASFMREGHAAMLVDEVRTRAFNGAFKQLNGARRVFDVGAGPTAFLSMLAHAHGFTVAGLEANPEAARTADRILREKGGFVVRCLAQGKEAKAVLKRFKPDAVVCELLGFLASGEGMPFALSEVQQACPRATYLPSFFATRFTLANYPRKDRSEQFTLVRKFKFDAETPDAMGTRKSATLEEFDCTQSLSSQLIQTRRNTLIGHKGVVNSLAFYIEACFPSGDSVGESFTSKAGCWNSATNWRNMILWLPLSLAIDEGDEVTVETSVDARAFPSKYAFTVTHKGRVQHVHLHELFP